MSIVDLIKELKNLEDNVLSGKTQPTMGWTCGYIPEEIPISFGFTAYRVRGIPGLTNEASGIMPGNLDPHVLSCLESALQGKYDFLNGIIIANTSDAMRRLYDVWQRYIDTPFVYILDVPKIVNDKSEQFFSEILLWLIESIEKHFGLKYSESALKEAINTCNETRELLGQIYKIKAENNSSIRNATLSKIFNLSCSVPKKEFNKYLKNFIDNFKNNLSYDRNNFPTILITGSFYDQSGLVDIIEEAGGKIVFEDICTRGRYYLDKVVLQEDPIKSLAKRYLNRLPCARMVNTKKRFEDIQRLIKKYNADAVVYYTLKFDDAYLFEFPMLKELLAEDRTPVIFIEGDGRFGNLGQLETRMQAFLETIIPSGR